jgi:serine/threonine-protein kinase
VTAPLARLTAALADRYRIERELGAGGMAMVYLAHDVRHERPVALKVLRPELAAIVGAERFLAEIKTTAHLQHPHILGLIDSGEVEGTAFYVMPFVRGESLRERITREQQLPVADAVRIATQIAGALDYAHRQGVIHRDIKPENVLLHDDQALVADFGIALALTRTDDDKTRMTETGMSLGTPQYMSPEQAMGERKLDARTDVYALGCVLYEMLSGEPPFTGPNAQAIVAKVMSIDPQPVAALRRSVPRNVADATMVALNKVPADRFSSAAAFAAALANPQYVAPDTGARRAARARPALRRRDLGGAAAIVILAVAAVMGWLRSSRGRSEPAVVARFVVPFPDSIPATEFTLSPDGSRIVWTTARGVYERHLDSLAIHRLRDPLSSAIRDVSPDGQDVLLGGRGGLTVASLSGGPARSLTTGGVGRGGHWTADGTVYYTFGGGRGARPGVARVPAAGGEIDTIVFLDSGTVILDVVVLPGARAMLASVERDSAQEVRAYSFESGTWAPLTLAGSHVQFIDPGYLIYANGAYVMAAPFDTKRLELTGQPIQIGESSGGNVMRVRANAGVLAYLAPNQTGAPGLVLRSRSGASTLLPNVSDSLQFNSFAAAPDGKRFVAVGSPFIGAGRGGRGGGRGGGPPAGANLYIYELPAGPLLRLRSTDRDHSPAWLPGGRELSFVRTNDSTRTWTLMKRTWDGTAPPTPLYTHRVGGTLSTTSWLPDGRRAVVSVFQGTEGSGGRGGTTNLMAFSLSAPDTLTSLITSQFAPGNPAVSRDGRLLAYTTSESGRQEVVVGPLDGSIRRPVSPSGGTQPRWSWSGRELFFRLDDTLFVASVRAAAEIEVGEVQRLFTGGLQGGYAVLPGDSLFVTRNGAERPPSLVVLVNLRQELQRIFSER